MATLSSSFFAVATWITVQYRDDRDNVLSGCPVRHAQVGCLLRDFNVREVGCCMSGPQLSIFAVAAA